MMSSHWLREDDPHGQERGNGSLSITVYPYKLTQRELEARLEPGLTVLPGQYLRFATPEPIFGQVREVRALPPSSPGLMGGYCLMISLLYGTPSLHPQQAILMSAAQMGHEIQRLQEPIAQPLRLSNDFSAELSRLGPLTLIGGDDFVQKYDILQLLMGAIHPYRRLIILDPLGIFAEEDGFTYWQAGRDVRLSVQAVGSKSFLDAFGELFAPSLREAALRVVADHLPPMHEFMGFQGLLDWYSALNVPLKNLILQNCQMVAKSHVFADTLEQALDWNRTANQAVTVLNLSALAEPWRGLFYREAVQALLEQSGDEVVPVLIYPENYLPNLSQWIQKADESEFKLLMLASPYVSDALVNMANNRFLAEMPEALSVIGSLTMGLPLTIPMPNRSGSQPAAVAHVPQDRVSAEPGFSSFNVAMLDEPEAPPVQRQVLPDMEAADVPLHWLGEAAGPTASLEIEHEEAPVSAPTSISAESTVEPLAEMADESPVAIDLGGLTEGPEEPPEESSVPEIHESPKPLPVVDLAAPPPEPTPEFLSASQLSDLLAFSPARPVEAPLPAIKPVSFSQEDDHVGSRNTVPEPLPKPEPVEQPSAATSEPPEEFNFPLSELEIEAVPIAQMPEVPVLPPFPTPEEYEKEEFHFDLNPDAHSLESISQGAAPAYKQNAVTQSLDDFASLDLKVDAASLAPATLSEPTEAPELSFDANIDLETANSAISQTDSDLQEALDLIFPHKGEGASPKAAPTAYAPTTTAVDEPIVIIQKSVEPSVSDSGSFHSGDRVTHPTYGLGVVQKVIPMEDSVVLNITFDSVGKRLLDPALCELSRDAVR